MEVKIPFKTRLREALLSGNKTATTRFKKYGAHGDTFEIFGATFELLAVGRCSLYEVALYEFKREGFTSPDDFWAEWRTLHPGRGNDPLVEVWFHVFRRMLCGVLPEMSAPAPRPLHMGRTLLCRRTRRNSCFECSHLFGESRTGGKTQQCGMMDLVERYAAHPQELMRITCDRWEWVEELVAGADAAGIPVFLKNNLTTTFGGDTLRQEWPG